MSKILTLYFSRKGQNYCGGTIRNLTKGNTEVVAEWIREATGADLFEVQTVKEYAEDYRKCTEEAKLEKERGERPDLKAYPENLDSYEIVFIGYPNWWGTMPMALFMLLEKYDWSGKKIIPFCTHEGSGMGVSERDLRNLCKGAAVVDGLAVRGSDVLQKRQEICEWAKKQI